MAAAGRRNGRGPEERTRRSSPTSRRESARRRSRARVDAFNSDWRELDRLISEQFWRVAFHRVAEDEINYRRFFNINDLAGLRMELAPVFEHAHARVFRMLESGGDRRPQDRSYRRAVRPEGLSRGAARARRPAILSRRREDPRAARAAARRLAGRGHDRLRLSQSGAWRAGRPVRRSRRFTETYRAFAGAERRFRRRSRAICKLRIMDNEMASELNALGRRGRAPGPLKVR